MVCLVNGVPAAADTVRNVRTVRTVQIMPKTGYVDVVNSVPAADTVRKVRTIRT